jgi:hypothetical protein
MPHRADVAPCVRIERSKLVPLVAGATVLSGKWVVTVRRTEIRLRSGEWIATRLTECIERQL